jgi:hypothetical protein
MTIPILDPAPSGRSQDWRFQKIQMVKGIAELTYPTTYKNPQVKKVAPRDQKDRGTCTGQATAYCFDLLYLALTGDDPTSEDKAQYKKDVIDTFGTTHDVLYPKSASAESAYQMGRYVGNITYPAGGEIRFNVRAWKDYGINLETQWHTDKLGTKVWSYADGFPQTTIDGGLSQTDAKTFAAMHRIEGYAMAGRSDGYATWDQVCYAIATKGFVLGAIPVYSNYDSMQGSDGEFPDPSGEIAGYHALCFYGYDDDYLYLLHSWGDFCGMFGKISKKYFEHAIDQSVWMVVLDSSESIIGAQTARTIPITCNVPALIAVDGVIVGQSPQKISCEPGMTYQITASADGYVSQEKTVNDGVTEIAFTLEAVVTPQPVKSWYQSIIDLIKSLIALFKRK